MKSRNASEQTAFCFFDSSRRHRPIESSGDRVVACFLNSSLSGSDPSGLCHSGSPKNVDILVSVRSRLRIRSSYFTQSVEAAFCLMTLASSALPFPILVAVFSSLGFLKYARYEQNTSLG